MLAFYLHIQVRRQETESSTQFRGIKDGTVAETYRRAAIGRCCGFAACCYALIICLAGPAFAENRKAFDGLDAGPCALLVPEWTQIELNLVPRNNFESAAISGQPKLIGFVCVGGGPVDSDGDGLSDDDEINIYGTDPFNPDTDGEGLTDGDEVLIHGTDPLNPDTDGDGISDFDEVTNGTDPLDLNDPSPFQLGDVNNDGIVSLLDVTPFVSLIFNATYQAEGDINMDGFVTVHDIPLFIAILTGG